MESDSAVKRHIGKLIGSSEVLKTISGEDFIQAFLKWHFQLNQSCAEDLFDKCYVSFEDFFHNSDLVSVESCRLFNFECDASETQLSPDMKIRKANQREHAQYEREAKGGFNKLHEFFSKSNHILEKRSKVRKIVLDVNHGAEPASSHEERERELKKHIESTQITFDNVIKLLRLIKHSAIYRDNQVRHEYDGYFGCFGSSSRAPIFENTALGSKCNLNQNDITDLKKFWQILQKEKSKVLKIALDRLSYTAERRNVADRILDSFIGLESLYLPDGNQELTFRLSLRVAMMIEDIPDKAQDTFLFVKKMYQARGAIVHGEKDPKIESAELERLEELLRISIKLFLHDKIRFSKKSLNAIFFKKPFSYINSGGNHGN